MKKWLKGILIACVVLLIAAFIGVAIFILTFDTTVYKNKLASMVKSEYNRDLIVNGEIKLSLFPRIGLNVSDVSLTEQGSKEIFAHIDNVRFAVAIWPLMSNRFLVDHMAVTGLKANIIRDENGLLNFDDLLNLSDRTIKESQTSSTATQLTPTPLNSPALTEWLAETDFKVDVAGMVLQKAQLNYRDLGLQHQLQLDNVQIDTGRITVGQAFDFHMVADVNGQQPQAAAKLDVNSLLLLNPQKQHYSAQKLRVNLEGHVDNLNIDSANLQGDFNIDTLSYAILGKGVEFNLTANGVDSSHTQTLNIEMDAPQLGYNASDLSLSLQDFSLNSRLQRKDKQAIEVDVQSPELEVTPVKAGGQPLTGKIILERTDQRMDLGFSLTNISGTAQDLKVEQVQLTGIYQPDEQRKLDMVFNSAGRFNVFDRQIKLPYIQGEIHLQEVEEKVQTFPVTGTLNTDLRQDQTDFNLALISSQGKLALTGIISNVFKPRISFDVSADSFNLDDFFADLAIIDDPESKVSPNTSSADKLLPESNTAAKESVNNQPSVATAEVEPQEHSGLSFKQELLSRLSGVGTFNFKQLSYHDVVFNNLGATLIFDQQDVQIKSLKAQVFDGQLSANGEYSLHDNALRADANFTDVQVQNLLAQLKANPLISGQMNLHVDMLSQGKNERELLDNLQATLEAQLADGAFQGVSIEELVSDPLMYYAQDPMGNNALSVDYTKQTRFNTFALQAKIADQEVALQGLDIQGDMGSLALGKEPAYYNWQRNEMFVPAQLEINAPVSVQQSGILIQVKNVSLPIYITGPRENLRIHLNKQ